MEKESTSYDEEMLANIIQFLDGIGIDVEEKELHDNCILPGLDIKGTTILYDKTRLKHSGDLLHEAGHIAVTPSDQRPLIGSDKMDPSWPSDADEIVTILWSFAALHEMKISPDVVFHAEGYKNESDWIIDQFESKNHIGLPLLEWMELCEVDLFPVMKKWLR